MANLPQPEQINKILEEKYGHKKEYDEFGWTGEYTLSNKDILDIIIDLGLSYTDRLTEHFFNEHK